MNEQNEMTKEEVVEMLAEIDAIWEEMASISAEESERFQDDVDANGIPVK